MNLEKKAPEIQKILVALDASLHSRAALDAAIDLATRFQAELTGLYVEDRNLLRLAGLSFVQEVGVFTATHRSINGAEISRQIRVQALRIRRIFTMRASQARLESAFRVARGSVPVEVKQAAEEADVLVLGKIGWSLLRHGQLGSTVRRLLPERFGLTLLAEPRKRLAAPVAVLFDGSSAGVRAIQTASVMRQQLESDLPLIVLLPERDFDRARELSMEVREALPEEDTMLRYRMLNGGNVLLLADILQSERCGLLVLPLRREALHSNPLQLLLEHVDLPVLLVT